MTRIAVDLPDDVAKLLATAWRDVSRATLEAVALEGYRDGTLTRDQVGRLLGLSFWDTEAFLKARGAYLSYDEQDFRTGPARSGSPRARRFLTYQQKPLWPAGPWTNTSK